MRKYWALLTVFILASVFVAMLQAQCSITASYDGNTLVCGQCATLTALGQGQGMSVFQEDFNSGQPTGWGFTQQASFDNPCSPNGVDGTTHIWMGDQTAVPRKLQTIAYDFSTASAGVSICFDLLFAEQGGAPPCEGPDEPDEGVALQYSIDGGFTWLDIHFFDPLGGYDPQFINWNRWCYPVPQPALTSSTIIRWFQDNDSGMNWDHWGIDNVEIFFNDNSYEITWLHDNYSYGIGNPGGEHPVAVCPEVMTTYTAQITNGINTCTATVTVEVGDPIQNEVVYDVAKVDAGCFGENNGEIRIMVSQGDAPFLYSIDGGQNYVSTATFTDLYADDYSIVVQDVNGCTFEQNVSLLETEQLIVDLGDDIEIIFGDTIPLIASVSPLSADIELTWTVVPQYDMSCTDCLQPLVSPPTAAVYQLTATDTVFNCTTSDELVVRIREKRLYIPNAFSPNFDGYNDRFVIFGGEDVVEIKQLKIFNRWGEMMYAAENFAPNDITIGWDGTSKGKALRNDVFVYFCEVAFTDGEVIVFKGDVMVVY